LQGGPIERKPASVLRSVLAAALGVGVIVGIATFEGAAALSVGACATTDASTVFSPQTGIIVQADPLIAGYGCGEGVGQVYKYAALVVDATGRLVAAQIYDCFADGTFVNLTGVTVDGGTDLSFTVLVYAWDLTAYTTNYDAIASGIGAINASAANDGGSIPNPFFSIPATWSTTCQATQTTNIEQLAVCNPLTPESTPKAPPPADGGKDGGTDSGEPDG
jgi:hypothetical protein